MSGAEVLRVVRGKHYSLSRWCRRGSALEVPVVTCQRGGGGKEEEVVMMRLYLGGFIPPTSHQPGHRPRLLRGSQLPRFLSAIRSPSLHVASFSPPPGSPLHLLATFSLRLRPPKLPDITNGKTLWGRVHGLPFMVRLLMRLMLQRCCRCYQISPTVKPSGNGSAGSRAISQYCVM